MNWPWTFLEIAVNALESLFFALLLMRQLDFQNNKKKYFILGYFLRVVAVTTLNFVGIPSLPTVLLMLVFDLCYSLFAFLGSLPKRILWGCAGCIIAQICNILTVNVFALFGHANLHDRLSPTQTRFEMMICYLLLYALFYFILAHIRPKRNIFLNLPMRIVLIVVFVIGLIAIQRIIDLNVIYSTTAFDVNNSIVQENFTYISLVIVGTFLGMMFMFEYIGGLAQKNLDAQAELQQTKFENSHLQQVQDTYQALRTWKHDFQNHIDVLNTYLKNNKIEDMGKYLSQFGSEIEPFMHFYSTGNTVADAVLSNKFLIARSRGIKIETTVVLPDKLMISDVQLCSLLSNLLDNAIEAQENVDSPFIQAAIRPERGMLFINLENSTNGKYAYNKKMLATTKSEKGHGIGLKQVRKIVEKAGGILDVKPQEDRFAVKILLPLEAEGEA